MRMVLTVLALLLPLATARAAAQSDVMATVQQFIDGSNKGDLKAAAAYCMPNAAIIDDFPPHVWLGANACANWANALAAAAKADAIAGATITQGSPRHVDITGDRAYVVLPVQYTYTRHGKPVVESGSTWTLALRKTPRGWRIAAWAWAEN